MTSSFSNSNRLRANALSASLRGSMIAATLSAALGVILVWGVGFSPIEIFHNAAHDVRHSNGFPCH
jgi:cobalt transporter subunit CbtB